MVPYEYIKTVTRKVDYPDYKIYGRKRNHFYPSPSPFPYPPVSATHPPPPPPTLVPHKPWNLPGFIQPEGHERSKYAKFGPGWGKLTDWWRNKFSYPKPGTKFNPVTVPVHVVPKYPMIIHWTTLFFHYLYKCIHVWLHNYIKNRIHLLFLILLTWNVILRINYFELTKNLPLLNMNKYCFKWNRIYLNFFLFGELWVKF